MKPTIHPQKQSTARLLPFADIVQSLHWERGIISSLPFEAAPSPLFWKAWRENKKGLCDYGFFVTKRQGKWRIAASTGYPLHEHVASLLKR